MLDDTHTDYEDMKLRVQCLDIAERVVKHHHKQGGSGGAWSVKRDAKEFYEWVTGQSAERKAEAERTQNEMAKAYQVITDNTKSKVLAGQMIELESAL